MDVNLHQTPNLKGMGSDARALAGQMKDGSGGVGVLDLPPDDGPYGVYRKRAVSRARGYVKSLTRAFGTPVVMTVEQDESDGSSFAAFSFEEIES